MHLHTSKYVNTSSTYIHLCAYYYPQNSAVIALIRTVICRSTVGRYTEQAVANFIASGDPQLGRKMRCAAAADKLELCIYEARPVTNYIHNNTCHSSTTSFCSWTSADVTLTNQNRQKHNCHFLFDIYRNRRLPRTSRVDIRSPKSTYSTMIWMYRIHIRYSGSR